MAQQVSSTSKSVSADLEAQRTYADKIKQLGFDFGLTVADAFVRGIRDIGYRHTGTALDELIDNSIQGEAESIHIVFGYGAKSDAKPDKLAVVDDGHGMDPDMIRLAMIWGGTHREAPVASGRRGFGRYGYGLPSSSVSQGRRFTVYSIVEGSTWHRVTLDLDDIGDGKYTDPATGKIVVPAPTPAPLPGWLAEFSDLAHGTIVVLEKLDRLTWVTATALERNLLQHFGVTYRNYLRRVNVSVNDKRVQPVDPLFITPGFRFYDEDEDRAESFEPMLITVKDSETHKQLGTIMVRFSYLPPTFQRRDKDKGPGPRNTNARFEIMKDHNGIIMLREGRQIDVITRGLPEAWGTLENYDRNWKVEVDFPPSLDEEFSITTSKQQVVASERIWTILDQAGVGRVIRQLAKRVRHEMRQDKERRETGAKKRASEEAMEEAQKYKPGLPGTDPLDRAKRSRERLEQEARRRARESGRSVDEETRELEAATSGQHYKVEQEAMPGAPFFRVDQVGAQTVLYLNTAHRFYTDVYAGPRSTPRLRSGLEVLLFAIGECELDTTPERQTFYQTERVAWSMMLNLGLDRLNQINSIEEETVLYDSAQEQEAPASVATPVGVAG